MTSIIKVNEIQDAGGNTILSSNGTGTFTSNLPSADNYPAFLAYPNADQTLSDGVSTKVVFNTENFDTNNCFDNTTNHRFTPTVAGKYFCFTSITLGSLTYPSSNIMELRLQFFKNGSKIKQQIFDFQNSYIRYGFLNISDIVSFNGSTDYLEVYAFNNVISGTPNIQADGSNKQTYFGAYRIGA